MSVDAILKEAEALSLDELGELTTRLWDQLEAAGWAPSLSEGMKAELDRRIAAADANPQAGIPWEVVKAESLKRARK